ncbi:MAG TPA: serine/threonine-protein kinase [Polyangia bacterium]|nr:serine/threonine-protein kinase [Polyangia bacterium]
MAGIDEEDRTPADGPPGPRRNRLDQRLFEGERVAGRYRVTRLIGAGAVGEVYEVEDELLHEAVALKTLREIVAEDAVPVERFRREIQLARRVTHRNVCRTFDVGQHDDGEGPPLVFITMELLRGPTLAEELASRTRFSVEDALPLVRQMVAGLEAAHAAGVVHRDFKPGNLVLVPDVDIRPTPRLVITDFGLARRSALDDISITITGEAVGTPLYMAPEQVAAGKQPISTATDVYALGVVLFEMLTGELPFKGSSITVMALKRFREAAPSPRTIRPDLDVRWERAILRCLEREPAARFQRAPEALAAITQP